MTGLGESICHAARGPRRGDKRTWEIWVGSATLWPWAGDSAWRPQGPPQAFQGPRGPQAWAGRQDWVPAQQMQAVTRERASLPPRAGGPPRGTKIKDFRSEPQVPGGDLGAHIRVPLACNS